MATVQLKSQVYIDIKELIGGVSKLDTHEIEHFLAEISMVLAQRKVSNLPERESGLLRKIGEGLPHDIQSQYDALQKKLLTNEITSKEHQELLELIETVESADAKRLENLIELSQLRQVSLDQLMSQLGIHHPPAYA